MNERDTSSERVGTPAPDDPRKPEAPTDLHRRSWAYVLRTTVRQFSRDHCLDLGRKQQFESGRDSLAIGRVVVIADHLEVVVEQDLVSGCRGLVDLGLGADHAELFRTSSRRKRPIGADFSACNECENGDFGPRIAGNHGPQWWQSMSRPAFQVGSARVELTRDP